MNVKVNTRLAKASAAFGWLHRNVWNRRGISEATKIKVYRAVVLTTLLYGYDTWTTNQRHIKRLTHFHTTCLGKIFGITWHSPHTEVLSRAPLPSIYTILMQLQLRWAGHVIRIKDHRLQKILLYGELSPGKRSQWDQKKCFKDTLKVSMKYFGATPYCLEYLAQDRYKWHEIVKRGAKSCEERRKAVTELHRKHRKGTVTSATTATIPCFHCPRLLHAQIGLIAYLCTHGSRLQS